MSDSKKTSKSRGLGRGLSALMSDVSIPADNEPSNETAKSHSSDEILQSITTDTQSSEPQQLETSNRGVSFVAIDWLVRNPDQPRRYFDPKKLEELTESIRLKGLLQPILVRPVPASHQAEGALYQIVAGERRWQAGLKAGLESIPVLIRDLSDQEVLELGVVENVQRADLNPIEEAQAYKALTEQFSRTQDEIAKAIGKSRPHITNMLRLLTLPEGAQELVREGKLSMGHARAIISAPDPNLAAQIIADKNMSVRQAEKYVRELVDGKNSSGGGSLKSADIRAVEDDLMAVLGLKIDLNDKGGKGALKINYNNAEQLEDLIRRLKG